MDSNFIPAGYQLHLITETGYLDTKKTTVLSGLKIDDIKSFVSLFNEFREFIKQCDFNGVKYLMDNAWSNFIYSHKIDLTTMFSSSMLEYNKILYNGLFYFIRYLVDFKVYYVPTRLEELTREFHGK